MAGNILAECKATQKLIEEQEVRAGLQLWPWLIVSLTCEIGRCT